MSIAKINQVTKANSKRVCGVVASAAAGGLLGLFNINATAVGVSFSTDYSIDLNGSTQYINLGSLSGTTIQPTQSSINSNGYSLACWMYIDSLSGGEYIFNIGASGTNNFFGFKVVVNGNGAFVFHVMGLNQGNAAAGSNNRNSTRTANGTISAGAWRHLAVVIPVGTLGTTQNRDGWKLFVDGSQVTSGLVPSGNQNVTLTYTGNSSFGAWTRSSVGNFFDGELNNQAVWNTELTNAAITTIYNSGAPTDISTNSGNYTQSSSLVGWWRYNEGTGTSYTDSSGNNRTGAGVNNPGWSTNVPT